MILRYIVETKHKPTFTASKKVSDFLEANLKVENLMKANIKAGHKKYTDFDLYTDNNVLICRL